MRRRHHQAKASTPYPRTARVNEVLREVVADALERAADVDDRLRMATVTAVDTAPDLSHATVFMSSMPDETAAALDAQRVHIQRAISREVRLKRTPQLVFALDPAVVAGSKVEEILRRIHDAMPESDDELGEPGQAGDDLGETGETGETGEGHGAT